MLVPGVGTGQPTLDTLQQDIKNIMDQMNISETTNPRVYITTNYLVVNDGTVNRIKIGLLADGSYGMVVSKPGVDVDSLFS